MRSLVRTLESKAAVLVALFVSVSAWAETAALNSKDYIIGERESGAPALDYYPDGGSSQVGSGGTTGARDDRNVVLGFTLPTLPAGKTAESAWLEFEIRSVRDNISADPGLDVYLLDTANPDSTGTNFFYHGAVDTATNVEFVGTTYKEEGTAEVTYGDDVEERIIELTGDALTLLKSFYGGDNTPDQAEAFFRFNLDMDPGLADYTRYRVELGAGDAVLHVSGVAAESASVNSKDSIIGRRQDYAPALGYYPGANRDVVGVDGSAVDTTRVDRVLVLGYTLPTLPSGTTVSNALLSFEITYTRDHNNQDQSLNVYLLSASNPDGSGTNYFYQGPSNTTSDAKFIDSTYIDEGTAGTTHADDLYDRTYQLTGEALDLLKSFYGGDNTPDQAEAFFRFNMDVIMPALGSSTPYERYDIDLGATESSLRILPTYPPPPGTLFAFQ